jgi:hypothetical protein
MYFPPRVRQLEEIHQFIAQINATQKHQLRHHHRLPTTSLMPTLPLLAGANPTTAAAAAVILLAVASAGTIPALQAPNSSSDVLYCQGKSWP